MYAVDIDGDVSDGDGVLVVSELHLQHALKAPAHEGDVRNPRGHLGVPKQAQVSTSHPEQCHFAPTPQFNPSPHLATCSPC